MAVTHLLWQEVDPHGVFVTVGPELDLCQHLVGEGVAHDEAGVAHGTAQVDQAALGQQDDVAAVAQGVAIHLWEQRCHSHVRHRAKLGGLPPPQQPSTAAL